MATLTPLPTNTPTATPPADDPTVVLGAPNWQASFATGANWYLFDDDHIKVELEDNNLVLVAKNPDNWEGWSIAWGSLDKFYLEIEGLSGEACQAKDRYGLIFRAPRPEEGYLFGISCDGHYRLRKWDGESFTTLLDWTESAAIRAGPNQVNRLGIMARGNRLTLYINGMQIGQIQDETYPRGTFGIFIGSSETENWTVKISKAAYWLLP